jgi:MoaA/NifB/PqqE/SkfB family radical SAM enzyme
MYALKSLYQRIKSNLTYHAGSGRSALPETVSLLLTYRCNLRCKMCGQWGESGSASYYTPQMLKRELGIDDVKKLISEIRRFSPTITLFGGEPLLHSDIVGIIEGIRDSGLRTNIITNGTLIEKYAEALVRLGVDEIIFSLDGPPKIHDRIRGKNGVFRRAKAGFLALSREKAAQKKKKPIVTVNSTIFDFNYELLQETYETAKNISAEVVTFHHLIFMNRAHYDEHNELMKQQFGVISTDWAGFLLKTLPAIDPDVLIEQLKRVTARGAFAYPNFTEDEIRSYYTDFSFSPKSYQGRCKSPWMVAYIFPDGSVRPCLSQGVSFGSITERSFFDIWNGEEYRRYRRKVKELGRFAACTRCTELYRF